MLRGMKIRSQIIELIDLYLSETGLTDAAFGRLVLNDHKFIRRLRSGIGVTLTSIERIERFIRENPAKSKESAA